MTDIDDITDTIQAKSDQLTADDLATGPITVKVLKAVKTVSEQPVTISYEGDGGKPYKPGKSMRRVLGKVWGKKVSKWAGQSLTLYCDPVVKFGGLEVGGIRISHVTGIDKPVTMALTASKANKKPFTVKPLVLTTTERATIDPAIKAAGDAAAASGVSAYTAFKDSLTPEQKETIKPYHSGWARDAKAADLATVADAPTSELPDNEEELPV